MLKLCKDIILGKRGSGKMGECLERVTENELLESIEQIIVSLYYRDDKERSLKILKEKITELKLITKDEFKIKKIELLEKNIKSYDKDLVSYSDYFFEQCLYILMCIKKGACCI